MIRICFVCLGNICRSPTAEGIMAHLVEKAGLSKSIRISSAGTGHWHVGELPDARSRAAAERRGVVLASRARQFSAEDFARFELIVAMDETNLSALRDLAPDDASNAKLSLLRSFDSGKPTQLDVPDPYFGADGGFDDVFDICERACRGLLDHLRRTHSLA